MSPRNLRLHKVMFPEKRNKGGSLFRNYKHDQGTEEDMKNAITRIRKTQTAE